MRKASQLGLERKQGEPVDTIFSFGKTIAFFSQLSEKVGKIYKSLDMVSTSTAK